MIMNDESRKVFETASFGVKLDTQIDPVYSIASICKYHMGRRSLGEHFESRF